MSKQTINGKKPLSSKPHGIMLNEPDFFTNKFTISPELIEEIKSQGLEYRFIDYKKYVNEGNQHSKGWRVYKPKKRESTDSFILGDNPDGILRRGSTVLAVRPVDWGNKHRAHLEQRRNLYKGFKESQEEQFRQKARELNSVIDTTYDGEDDEDEN